MTQRASAQRVDDRWNARWPWRPGPRRCAHFGRMALQLVEAHEGARAMDVGLLRPYAAVQITDALTDLIEQA